MTENHSAKNEAAEAAKRNVVEKMWLNYYNNVLLEKGLITETQHRKMKLPISSPKPSAMALPNTSNISNISATVWDTIRLWKSNDTFDDTKRQKEMKYNDEPQQLHQCSRSS